MSFKAFKKKLLSWLEDFFEIDLGFDVDVDIAKANCQKYRGELESRLKRDQEKYIKALRNNIKIASRNGSSYVRTKDSFESFMTHGYMMELKNYFEQRGFCVEVATVPSRMTRTYLIISWK